MKAAIIIASHDFRDEEYFVTKEILERSEIKVKTVCDKNRAIGRFGGEAEADFLINDFDPEGFDAVIFAGGNGAPELLDNEASYNIARKTLAEGKLLSAICIAPTILAKAGILKGRRATVWSKNMDKSAIKILEENGAIYEKEPVVIDNNIITGENAEAAEEFGKAIAGKLLKNKI